uniref:Uncharacterized protein n=1 Tax=Sphaerodactylus townsendi TaxID=933632 RepID=A0ACB8G340_9SAUR
MPQRKDTVLSSEEESDGTVYSRRTPNKNSGEEDSSPERVPSSTEKARQTSGEKSAVSRQTKEARKMAAARRDGEGTAPKSPQCLGIPGQGSEIAAAAPESQSLTVAELQEGGKLSLKDLKTEIFSYVKGAFQQEKDSMREEMIALYRGQVYQPSSPPNSSRASPTRQTIREKKRANPTWQTKAALKKPRLSPALGAGDSSDADSLSREEGEVLSDIEDLEEIQVTEQSSRLFKIEDYQYLLSKAVSALHLGEAKSGEGKSKRKSTSLHKGDGKYFPSDAHSKKVFPFPEYFETQVTNEWDKPAANRRCPNFLRKLYALPAYANDILQVPIIDGPVAALQSTGAVSKDGRGQIKDLQDRRADQLCRRSHEAMAMVIRASATASIVCRASIAWAKKVLELLPETETRSIEGVNRMLRDKPFNRILTRTKETLDDRIGARAALNLRKDSQTGDNREPTVPSQIP